MQQPRRVLPAVESAALLVVMMFVGSLVLWIGVPAGWLWIGSRLQNGSSLAAAVGAMMIGMLLTIVGVLALLGWLNRKHVELLEARGRTAHLSENATTALELVRTRRRA